MSGGPSTAILNHQLICCGGVIHPGWGHPSVYIIGGEESSLVGVITITREGGG